MTKEELYAAIDELGEEDRQIMLQIVQVTANTLINESGGMVLLADIDGNGTGCILTCGNPLVALPLISTAKDIIKRELEPTGVMQ